MFGVAAQSLLPNSSSPIYGAHNSENDWIWVGIASEAKLRGENNDEQRPDTNTKKHQADPQKARHTSVGRSCDFAHIRKLHLTRQSSAAPSESAVGKLLWYFTHESE